MSPKRMFDRTKIRELCDGIRSSSEIADLCGYRTKYVQQVMLAEDLPRRSPGPPFGGRNPNWSGGHLVDLDGYLLVRWNEHPNIRATGYILAHRIVLEMKIGRLLDLKEVGDHINGLKLDNRPENLHLFADNGQHLAATLSGIVPKWTEDGLRRMNSSRLQRRALGSLDIYRQSKGSGVVRELQIDLLRSEHGTDAISLLRTVLRKLKSKHPHPLGPLPSYLL